MITVYELLKNKTQKKDKSISLKVPTTLKDDIAVVAKYYDVSVNECINIILEYQITSMKIDGIIKKDQE